MKKEVYTILETIKEEINMEYGFIENTPCINYGPCGVFAYLFYQEWMSHFHQGIHICFVMMKDVEECYHVCLHLDTGELYDGGIGIHTDEVYQDFIIQDMVHYDHTRLEKWSYGLDRTYPRYCPSFNQATVKEIIHRNISCLQDEYD